MPIPPQDPLSAIAAGLGVGPRMAGRCSGVPIRPGQDPQALVNSRPAGTKFCFAAGLHRIRQTIRPKAGTTLASSARAVLTDSVRLTSWTQAGSRWIARGTLPAAYGQSGRCEDSRAHICHLREQLFVNGAHQRQVAALSQVRSGTFFADYGKNVVYLGTDPRGRTVEMSRTPTAIESGARGVTVRGLTIDHFASAPADGVRFEISRNGLIDRKRGNGPWGRYLLRDVRIAGNYVVMRSGSQSTGVVQNSGAELPAGTLGLRPEPVSARPAGRATVRPLRPVAERQRLAPRRLRPG